jgi:putative membrane protein
VRRRRVAGATAVVSFALAIAGLEPWTGSVLSVHMTQHLLLMVVVAPLAVLASPLRAEQAPRWARGASFAATAVAAQAIALVVWHVPVAFDAAERLLPLHVLEHVSLLVTAAATWWVIIASPASIGVRFAACLASAAPMMLLGALMTLAPDTWYDAYAGTHGTLSPLVDQQTAGALMWGPAGIAYVVAAAGIVASVVRADEGHRLAGVARR